MHAAAGVTGAWLFGVGTLEINGEERKLWRFTLTLSYSRTMMAEAAVDQKLGTLLRVHEEAFRQLGRSAGRDSLRSREDGVVGDR
jgi:transposase